MTYIWQKRDWPAFRWDPELAYQNSQEFAREVHRLDDYVRQLSETEQQHALVDLMVSEAMQTSWIEGEKLAYEDVRAAICHDLGLSPKKEAVGDAKARGVVAMLVSARNHFSEPLTAERLCEWQDHLIVGRYDRAKMETGRWRSSPQPMQIVSGAYGKEVVHYEAPPAAQVPAEMARFIEWFNTSHDLPGPVRAGIAHLQFECIHPFDDGNGRVGRALAEVAISQDLGRPALLSLATTIAHRREAYYDQLSMASKGGLDITEWLDWFTKMVVDAQVQSRRQAEYVVARVRFWGEHAASMNERQEKAIRRMLLAGPDGFEGGMSARKYAKITKCAEEDAAEDLRRLLEKGVLLELGSSGRGPRYEVNLTPSTESRCQPSA